MGQAIVLDEGACTSSPRNVCYSGNSLVLADRRSPGFWLKPIERRHRFELRGIFWRCRTIIGRLATLSAPCDPEELFLSGNRDLHLRSEEHTSELQSLMRISYAVFCLKKKKKSIDRHTTHIHQ